MTRPKVTSGKRQRQEQKRSKARAKAERRSERQAAADQTPIEPSAGANESQLAEELAELHRALESGTLGLQEFEEKRERIRTQLEGVL